MKKELPQKAIILVGGFGKRLYPLTYSMPKPLVPFCNKPMIYYQIEKLAKIGINVIILALNYYSKMIIDSCKIYEEEFNIKIIHSIENEPLGTGGPIGLAKKHLKNGPFFVLNSDILCNIDLSKLVEKYMSTDCLALIMTSFANDPSRYGLIKYKDDKIISFEEKPKFKAFTNEQCMINAGIYIFSESILDLLEPKNISLEKDIFTKLAKDGKMVYFNHDGYWADIGQFKDYLTGQETYLKYLNKESGNKKKTILIGKNCKLGENVEIGDNTVIGDNVTIGNNVVCENCTIFNNVIIGSDCIIKDSIIGWNCEIEDKCLILSVSVLGKSVKITSSIVLVGKKVVESIL